MQAWAGPLPADKFIHPPNPAPRPILTRQPPNPAPTRPRPRPPPRPSDPQPNPDPHPHDQTPHRGNRGPLPNPATPPGPRPTRRPPRPQLLSSPRPANTSTPKPTASKTPHPTAKSPETPLRLRARDPEPLHRPPRPAPRAWHFIAPVAAPRGGLGGGFYRRLDGGAPCPTPFRTKLSLLTHLTYKYTWKYCTTP